MKMIIVIVKDNDADVLTQAFTANSFRVTRVASTGGFMRSGVVTMLLGVEEEQVDAAMQTVRDSLPPKADQKRATIFVVPVQHFEQVWYFLKPQRRCVNVFVLFNQRCICPKNQKYFFQFLHWLLSLSPARIH